jgi:uncharacterized pyridoxamine 5'-phosphate oxidase family protein
MNEIIAFLKQNKFGSLATCRDGKADVRPFELSFHCERGLFFYTSEKEDVYEQLKLNPYICFCATDQNYNYAKISGTVLFSESEDDKAKIISSSSFAEKAFAGDKTGMRVFYLPHADCMLHDHADNNVIERQF